MTMPNVQDQPIGRQLRRMFVRMLLRQQDAPESLYLGLATQTLEANANMAMVEAFELRSPGYRRQRLDPAAWNLTDVPSGVQAVAEGMFTNTSEENWPEIAASFLTTARSGSDGILVAMMPLKSGPIEMRPGWVIDVPVLLDYGA